MSSKNPTGQSYVIESQLDDVDLYGSDQYLQIEDLEREIEVILDYVNRLEKSFLDDLKKIEANSENYPDDENISEQEWDDLNIDQKINHEKMYHDIFLYSTLISIYSLLEKKLINLCHSLQKEHSYRITVEDLSDDGIVRGKKYLNLVAGIDIHSSPAANDAWIELCKINKVRNRIVHHLGRLPKGEEEVEKFVEKCIDNNQDIEVDSQGFIKIKVGYLKSFLEYTRVFLSTVISMAFPIS